MDIFIAFIIPKCAIIVVGNDCARVSRVILIIIS